MTDELPAFNLFDSTNVVYTRPRLLPPSKIFGTTINRSVIAEGGIIHAKAIEHCLVGIRSEIGRGTVVKDSIIFGNDSYQSHADKETSRKEGKLLKGIGENCHVERAIIDKEVFIGNNVIIRGHDSLSDATEEQYVIRDGIIVIKKGMHIPDGTVIGAAS
ncbi:MAG: glucose-1-phosphate adenylyltransferase, partial [Bacteroidota bacterium]